eukprot:gene27021-7376_t
MRGMGLLFTAAERRAEDRMTRLQLRHKPGPREAILQKCQASAEERRLTSERADGVRGEGAAVAPLGAGMGGAC